MALVHGYAKPLKTQQISKTTVRLKPLILLNFRHIHAPTPTSLTIQATVPLPQREYRLESTSSGLAPPNSRQSLLNRRSNKVRRRQGCHRAVEAALLEEHDCAEQVMADACQAKNNKE
jgi:hypothetical protein